MAQTETQKTQQQDTGKFRTNTKDQYYTRAEVAASCVRQILQKVEGAHEYQWIEPAAGNGAFLRHVPEGVDKIGIDIDPKAEGILQGDFLKWAPGATKKRRILFGNPPFGSQSSIAKKFIEHGASFCDIIAFILPRSFEKPSMNRAFPMNFHCVLIEHLSRNSFEVNEKPYDVPCIFMIWVRKAILRQKPALILPAGFRYVKSDEAWHLAFRRVGGLAGRCYSKDGTFYSPQSHYFLAFEDRFQNHLKNIQAKINAHEFPSNTVGPRSLSKHEVNEVINRILTSCS